MAEHFTEGEPHIVSPPTSVDRMETQGASMNSQISI